MEKKIEVEVSGRKVRIMEHQLKDAEKFGATIARKIIKSPPPELIKKTIIVPEPEIVITPAKADPLKFEKKTRKK
jgi:hypothetical protein